MSGQTSFKMDILPLFTERDIKGMSRAFDLTDYNAVKAHAEAIRDRIRGIGGAVMPPSPPVGDGPWPQSDIDHGGSRTTARPESQPAPTWFRIV
jgi:hypothetical protein